ncbi:MAG: hypothetical protein HYS12_01540, partial [Planctomycetes bacterium]|nr:hypothetical protein [Planctomycetota bacterium]
KDPPPPPDKEGIARGRPEESPSKGRDGEKNGTNPEQNAKDPRKPSDPAGREKPSDDPPGRISTGQVVEPIKPGEVTVWVPSLFKLRELTQETERKRLQQDLARDKAFYLELLCREGTHAFPRVQAALKAAGVDLLVDPLALARLKNPQFRTNYFVYLEDLTADELGKVLEGLGGPADTHFDPKKPALGQFAGSDFNVVLFRMMPEHRKFLSLYLGVDLRQTGGKTPVPVGVDLSRPLAEQTADPVVGALATGAARPSAGTSADKAPQRWGLAMASGQAHRPQSSEVKRFLEGRKPPRKGTLQVILVLRGKA